MDGRQKNNGCLSSPSSTTSPIKSSTHITEGTSETCVSTPSEPPQPKIVYAKKSKPKSSPEHTSASDDQVKAKILPFSHLDVVPPELKTRMLINDYLAMPGEMVDISDTEYVAVVPRGHSNLYRSSSIVEQKLNAYSGRAQLSGLAHLYNNNNSVASAYMRGMSGGHNYDLGRLHMRQRQQYPGSWIPPTYPAVNITPEEYPWDADHNYRVPTQGTEKSSPVSVDRPGPVPEVSRQVDKTSATPSSASPRIPDTLPLLPCDETEEQYPLDIISHLGVLSPAPSSVSEQDLASPGAKPPGVTTITVTHLDHDYGKHQGCTKMRPKLSQGRKGKGSRVGSRRRLSVSSGRSLATPLGGQPDTPYFILPVTPQPEGTDNDGIEDMGDIRSAVFSCDWPQCGKSFSRPDELSRHAWTHNKKQQDLNCAICGRQYTRNDHFQTHVKKCKEKRFVTEEMYQAKIIARDQTSSANPGTSVPKPTTPPEDGNTDHSTPDWPQEQMIDSAMKEILEIASQAGISTPSVY